MRFRHILGVSSALAALAVTVPSNAVAEDPQTFIEHQHHHIEQLLHEPESPSRDSQVHESLSGFVDYDELTHRAFGEPCPVAEPGCEDLWVKYDDTKKAELRSLLEQLVRKNYQRNLLKTLDYDVTYRGAHDAAAGDTRVLTEAKNKLKPREPAVRIDYVVKQTGSGPKVVDIITEGASLTKNYYDQFRKKMNNPAEGYPNIVQKLKDKIAKKD